jgi:glycosyltransferase involved in cell wall biosynthesis
MEKNMTREALTVAILTKNEELLIERAIRSASWADEVLILDSGSTDRTVEIATRLGARVVHQPWLGWRGQHQKAVDLASNDWVMKIDADEIFAPQLVESICKALDSQPDPKDGYVVDRLDEFMGELVPNARRRSRRMTFVRMFNRRFSQWDPEVLIHERVKVAGSCRMLEGPLLHWRNASFSRMIETYNANAEVESRVILSRRSQGPAPLAIIFKPMLRFGWVYFVCGGWRRGMRGYLRAVCSAMGEFLSLAKAWEKRHAPPCIDPPKEYQIQSGAAGAASPRSATWPSLARD